MNKMSESLIHKNEGTTSPTSAPPTYQEATQSEAAHKPASYPKQEYPAGVPVMLTMPVPLRNVGSGDVVYVVNQNGASEPTNSNLPFGASFEDKKIRAGFVRKVYTILMLQLLTTLAIIAWFVFHEPTRRFVQRHTAILWASYIVFLVTYISLVCCSSVRRNYPCNMIVLIIFTLAKAYLAAAISAFHDTYIVIMTIGIVTVVCLGISLFAVQTKWDVTGWGLYLCAFGLVVFVFGIVALIVGLTTGNRIMFIVYSGLLALVFSLYLVYDTQQIIGGRKVELSAEEHVYGALQLYIDIINLYLILLSLNSSCK